LAAALGLAAVRGFAAAFGFGLLAGAFGFAAVLRVRSPPTRVARVAGRLPSTPASSLLVFALAFFRLAGFSLIGFQSTFAVVRLRGKRKETVKPAARQGVEGIERHIVRGNVTSDRLDSRLSFERAAVGTDRVRRPKLLANPFKPARLAASPRNRI
jgi:hypothetical protein